VGSIGGNGPSEQNDAVRSGNVGRTAECQLGCNQIAEKVSQHGRDALTPLLIGAVEGKRLKVPASRLAFRSPMLEFSLAGDVGCVLVGRLGKRGRARWGAWDSFFCFIIVYSTIPGHDTNMGRLGLCL